VSAITGKLLETTTQHSTAQHSTALTLLVHDVDVPLQAVEHVAQHVRRAAVAQAAKVLAQEEGLVLKAGVGEGLQQQEEEKREGAQG